MILKRQKKDFFQSAQCVTVGMNQELCVQVHLEHQMLYQTLLDFIRVEKSPKPPQHDQNQPSSRSSLAEQNLHYYIKLAVALNMIIVCKARFDQEKKFMIWDLSKDLSKS